MRNQFESGPESEVRVVAYAWGGHIVDRNDPKAVAKESFDPETRVTRYWIKRCSYGPEAGFLYNPQSPNHSGLDGVNPNTREPKYVFDKATKGAFDLYLKFITHPHNPVDLRGAERSL